MSRTTLPEKLDRQTRFTRLTRLGIFSLSALILGGLTLLGVGVNALVGLDPYRAPPQWEDTSFGWEYMVVAVMSEGMPIKAFYQGARLKTHIWLAVIGLGFGFVSIGVTDVYHHLFDWWSSRQALSPSGLDYARYLNSQPRSPVSYGARGFVHFATLKHFLTAMTIFSSVGYKFGIVNTEVEVIKDAIPNEKACQIQQSRPGRIHLLDPLDHGTHQRFFHEPLNNSNLYHPFLVGPYYNRLTDEEKRSPNLSSYAQAIWGHVTKPPSRVALLGELDCYDYKFPRNYGPGHFHSVETIIVADLIAEKENFYMSDDQESWQVSDSWSRHELRDDWKDPRDLIISYRILEPEKKHLEIQWQFAGASHTDPKSIASQMILHRFTYEIRHATAEVRRAVSKATHKLWENGPRDFNPRGDERSAKSWFGSVDTGAATLGKILSAIDQPIRLLSISENPIIFHNISTATLPRRQIDAGLMEAPMRPLNGVSLIVRYAMAQLSVKYSLPLRQEVNQLIKIAAGDGSSPSTNHTKQISLPRRPFSEYPYYSGIDAEGSGCYRWAAIAFIIVGSSAIVLALLRILVGPPLLTSWIAQHIYLSQTGAISFESANDSTSGYDVVPQKSLILRLGNIEHTEDGNRRKQSLAESESDPEDYRI